MRIALIDGQRRQPEHGLRGTCQCCDNTVIAKCGPIRVHHWAHKAGIICPYDRDPETQWHLDWKANFPLDWQERRFVSAQGEVHIADLFVPIGKCLAIEIQHSPITPAERASREHFYARLLWIVDGTRRERDWSKFHEEWLQGEASPENVFRRLIRGGHCPLLRDWQDSKSPVFFDFGQTFIWGLAPIRQDDRLIVGPTTRTALVAAILRGELPKMLRPVQKEAAPRQKPAPRQTPAPRRIQTRNGTGRRWKVWTRY